MGTSSWSNTAPRDLVVPPGAGPGDPQIVIGPDVPAELQAYYALHYSAVLTEAYIRLQPDTGYKYLVIMDQVGRPAYAEGFVQQPGAVVRENLFQVPTGSPPGLWNVETLWGAIEGARLAFGATTSTQPSVALVDNTTWTWSAAGPDTGTDRRWNTHSLPRGRVAQVNAAADSALIAAVETAVLTTGTIVFEQSRAYRAEFGNRCQGDTAGNTARFRLRQTSAAGTLLTDYGDTENTIVGADYNASGPGFFLSPASTIVDVLCLTLARANGAGNVQQVGNGGGGATRRFLIVEDIGAASDFPNFATLV